MTKVIYMAAISVALISGVALLGWWTDHAMLATYLPGIANMAFNTALCFMLVALVCSILDKGTPTFFSIRFGTGLFVGLFALLSLLQDLLGLNFGIDNLLFDSHGYSLTSPYPGRMSPLTATGFLFVGMALSLLSMHHSRPNQFSSIIHVLIILVGIIALAGISINVLITQVMLDVYTHLASISLFTAISFLLLAIALISIFQQRYNKSGINLLLHSGIQLMYKLKYPQKFGLISTILIIPVGILMWNEIKLAEHDVANARLKIAGIAHIRLNADLLRAIPEHRGMVNAHFANPGLFSQAITQKTKQIDKLLSANSRMDQLHIVKISIPSSWSKINVHWASIKEDHADQVLQWHLHTEIITLITIHLRNVADESGLTFDESPILHNLLAAQVNVIPALLEQIGQLRGQGAGLINHKNIARDEQLMFAAMISRTNQYSEEIQRLLRKTSETGSTIHLAHLNNAMVDEIHKFITMTEQQFIVNRASLLSTGHIVKQEIYFKQASSVMNQGYRLSDILYAYIEQQLHKRINDRIITQCDLKLIALSLLLLLLFFFASFYRSVMNTIQALDRTAENMRRGDVNTLTILPATDELGDVVGSFNTIAEELMRVSSHMSAVVDHAFDGIITINCKGIVKSFNPASEHIFGYMADEVIGQNITMLMPDTYRERHLSGLQHYCEEDEGRVLGRITEVHGLRKNGEEFPMELSINTMLIENERMFIGMVRDSSKHREMELQLRHAQKMEAIGELVGGLAHNFNNLLAAILGKAYLAQRNIRTQPENVRTHLKSIESISIQAADMVKQLLTFSHKDFLHDKKEIPLALLIQDGFKTAKLGIAEDINLSLNITATEVRVFCDGNQIQQVLMNMMNNARDAVADCAEKSISVSLDVYRPDVVFFYRHSELADGEYVCLQIADSGHGMDNETVERIFEPFYTTKEVGKGTGLGLSSAFGSIASHGGAIEVNSQLGCGTTFRVYLPIVETTEIETTTGSNQAVIPSSGHETLLLVDDEPVILHSIQGVLEDLGYKVITAPNGAEGLICFQQHQHDITAIITDVVMPKMGGMDMFRQIRNINATMPTIFITGYDQGKVQLQSDEMENTVIISKPIQIPELSQLVKQILNNKLSST